MSDQHCPIRILHVVHHCAQGGVEKWLLDLLRRVDRTKIQFDFLVHGTIDERYALEAKCLGSRLFSIGRAIHFRSYARRFNSVLGDNGPYAVVHSHVFFSGLVLRLAKAGRVPVRWAHCHATAGAFRQMNSLLRTATRATNRWLWRDATMGFGCSRPAAEAMFGLNWTSDSRWRVLYYGVEVGKFRENVSRLDIRRELDLPENSWVIGHVGRFATQKNHVFLSDIAAEVAKRDPRMYLLLIGDGPLRASIQERVNRLGISPHVRFLGNRDDVPRLMTSAMDVFLLPSLYEGLPIVAIEAQAAGLPCLLADTIAEEIQIVPPLVSQLSLALPAQMWAEALLNIHANLPTTEDKQRAYSLIEASPFSIQHCASQLESMYLREYEQSLSSG